MAESPLYDLPARPGVICDRCGRMFERPGTVERDGQRVTLLPHVKGGAACVPVPGKGERDARRRREQRARL